MCAWHANTYACTVHRLQKLHCVQDVVDVALHIMCLQLGVQYFISFYLRLFHTHMHDPPSHPIFDFFLCACWHRTPLNNYKARLLAGVQEEFNEDLVLIMRVRYNCRDSVCRLKLERDTTSTSVGRVQHSTSPPGRCIRASKLC